MRMYICVCVCVCVRVHVRVCVHVHVCVYEHWPWLEIGLPANVVVYSVSLFYITSSDDGLKEVRVPVCPILTPIVDHFLAYGWMTATAQYTVYC